MIVSDIEYYHEVKHHVIFVELMMH